MRHGFIAALLVFFVLNTEAQTCPGSLPAGIECVAAGANKDITAHSTCAKITNSHASGKALMVPIGNTTDWSTFRTQLAAGVSLAACGAPPAETQILLSTIGSTVTMTVPVDWNSSNNRIECVGAGGGGNSAQAGGGGGAYVRSNNVTLVPGSSYYYLAGREAAAGQDGLPSCISTATMANCTTANLIKAAGALSGDNGGIGGAAGDSMSNFLALSGGDGASGGGGSAAPGGAGRNGGAVGSSLGGGGGGHGGGTDGQNGDDAFGAFASGGAGATGLDGSGGNGGPMNQAGDSSYSSNDLHPSMGTSGGGGGAAPSFGFGSNGGHGGPGGGGGSGDAPGAGGKGGQGFCVLTYVP